MNVLFITGSARKNGITSKLCDIVGSSISDAAPDTKLTFIRPYGLKIEHCCGCGSCSQSGKCSVDDDMCCVYRAVEENDMIVLAVPIYFSGPSSVIKQVIDRFQCVWAAGSRMRNKAVALIVAGGHDSPVFSNTISITKAFAITIGATWIGELTVSGTDLINEIPDDLAMKTRNFGTEILSAYLRSV